MSAFPGDFATAETSVFWDIEDCKMDDHRTAAETLHNIRLAISSGGHRGPVSIRAYGDMTGYDFPTQEINLNHFPAGARFARHTKKMLEDIISWAAQQPKPSNLMLIMRNISQDFVEAFDILKSRNHHHMIHIVS